MNVPKLRFKEFSGEWEQKTLGEVIRSQGGKALEKFVSENGTYKFISIGNYSSESKYFDNGSRIVLNDETCKQLLSKDDLVMILNDKTSEGNIIGRTLLIESDNLYVYNQRSQKIVCEDDVLPKYLYFYTNGVLRNQIIKNSQGATQIYINFPVIEKMTIDLPSIDEQEKIGLFLEGIDEKIVNQKAIIESLEKQKKALMQKIFSQELRLKDENGKEYPVWEERKFGEVIELNRGSSPRPIEQFITRSDDGVPWIRIGDVPQNGNVIERTTEKITREGAKKSRFVGKGELILSNSMSFGKPYVMGFDGYIHDGWFVLRNYSGYFTTGFLNFLLCSDKVQKQYQKLAAGGVVNNISSSLVNSAIVIIPSIKEQVKIVEFLQCFEEKVARQREILNHLQQIKKGLLQQMFV